MAVTNTEIEGTTKRYIATWPAEEPELRSLLDALADGADLIGRGQFDAGGHVTCGAAIVNSRGEVLFVLNRPLQRWLLPGGHVEPTDASLLDAARREVLEETDIAGDDIIGVFNEGRPIEIGVHRIPANNAKNEPGHWHADFCFAFQVDDPALVLQQEEVGDSEWRIDVDDIIPGLALKLGPFRASGVTADPV